MSFFTAKPSESLDSIQHSAEKEKMSDLKQNNVLLVLQIADSHFAEIFAYQILKNTLFIIIHRGSHYRL